MSPEWSAAPPDIPNVPMVFGYGFIVAGLCLTIPMAVIDFNECFQITTCQPVKATITKTEVGEDPNHSAGYLPTVEFDYLVDGKQYHSDKLEPHIWTTNTSAEADTRTEPYEKG